MVIYVIINIYINKIKSFLKLLFFKFLIYLTGSLNLKPIDNDNLY